MWRRGGLCCLGRGAPANKACIHLQLQSRCNPLFPQVAALSPLIACARVSRSVDEPATFWKTNQSFPYRTSFLGVVEVGKSWSLQRNWVAGIWKKPYPSG